ncbi:MAG: asparagine synthase [Alphaproteobacteria bacterium]|nr:asparagine synthase [Alphaproteobacteria bacterium]
MAGIAGILKKGEKNLVLSMLESISHRGSHGKAVYEYDDATIGMIWAEYEDESVQKNQPKGIFSDGPGFGHKIEIKKSEGHWQIYRDELGVAPMYYSYTKKGNLYFASEVKALLSISEAIRECLPGSVMNDSIRNAYFKLEKKSPVQNDPNVIATELLNRLIMSVTCRITTDTIGAWLSGGLDSSTIAALARPWVKELHTFAGGLKNASDLSFAREVAKHIGSNHHEVIINFRDMLRVLPRVIYHLESFDALLVRSSIINYLVADIASGYVGEVFSGEGGDELFAGYQYLKSIPANKLDDELIDITGKLHNTAFQRVDRCAAAHGLMAHVVFADPQLFDFAFRIPSVLKLKSGIEKWILRKSVEGMLPENIVWRPKTKFWEGAGVEELISDYASAKVTDSDFKAERNLENGWILRTKEELFYYRIFKEQFNKIDNLDWMGRTKNAPVN